MVEILKSTLSYAGIPGLIIGMVSILIKLSPLTFLTSTNLERKFYSKERKAMHVIFNGGVQIVLYSLIMLFTTSFLFNKKEMYNSIIGVVWVGILVVSYIWITWKGSIKEEKILDLPGFSRNAKILVFIFLLVLIVASLFMPAYVIGSQIYPDFMDESNGNSERIGALIALNIIYIMVSLILLPTFKTLFNFIDFKSVNPNYIHEGPFFIWVKNEKWYIFHATDKNNFVLGNKSTLKESTKFLFLDKKTILENEIQIENSQIEADVEYCI